MKKTKQRIQPSGMARPCASFGQTTMQEVVRPHALSSMYQNMRSQATISPSRTRTTIIFPQWLSDNHETRCRVRSDSTTITQQVVGPQSPMSLPWSDHDIKPSVRPQELNQSSHWKNRPFPPPGSQLVQVVELGPVLFVLIITVWHLYKFILRLHNTVGLSR